MDARDFPGVFFFVPRGASLPELSGIFGLAVDETFQASALLRGIRAVVDPAEEFQPFRDAETAWMRSGSGLGSSDLPCVLTSLSTGLVRGKSGPP